MDVIGLVLDGLVLVLLGATIFVAWRLSENLNAFRKGRKELETLVQELSRNIEKAEQSVAGLKNVTRDAGKDLQVLIGEARSLSDELQLMTEAGDNIASRLERLAERNRDIAERIEKSGGASPVAPGQVSLKRVQESKSVPTGLSFAIRDREFDAGVDELAQMATGLEADEWPSNETLHSKAERELFEALRKSGKSKTGGQK
jgi:predicted RNase H-like nuclease (RuvC/YqgF family)